MKSTFRILSISLILSMSLIFSSCNLTIKTDDTTVDQDQMTETSVSKDTSTTETSHTALNEEQIDEKVEETVDMLLLALTQSDFETINDLTIIPFHKISFFGPQWDEAEDLFLTSFEDMQWSIDNVERVSDASEYTHAVTASLTYRDPITVGDHMMLDGHQVEKFFKPFIDLLLNKSDQESSQRKMVDFFNTFLFEELKQDYSITTNREVFEVQYNSENNEVKIISLPFLFHYYANFSFIDPSSRFDDETVKESIRVSAGLLYENEDLTTAEYEEIMQMFPD